MTALVKRGAPRAVADVSEGLILASVEIAAPPERVFRALTSAEVLEWWSTATDYRTTKWSGELVVGGAWRADGVSVDGSPFFVEGEFLELDPPRKVVQTWRAGWDESQLTTITYRLEPIATGTRVTLRHAGFTGRPEMCLAHTAGWEPVLFGLQSYFTPAERS